VKARQAGILVGTAGAVLIALGIAISLAFAPAAYGGGYAVNQLYLFGVGLIVVGGGIAFLDGRRTR